MTGHRLTGVPLVSIVVPTHLSEPPFRAETLASVVAQERANWEVMVDDGSPDAGALAELGAVDRRIRVVRQERGGSPAPATSVWSMPVASWWPPSTTTTCGTPVTSRRRSTPSPPTLMRSPPSPRVT
jgi:hypothetical protein